MSGWPVIVRLGELAHGPRSFTFEADNRVRMQIAQDLHLATLDRLVGEATISPWLDGAQIDGAYEADLAQVCSVTAEPLPLKLANSFSVRVLPAGSPNAAAADAEIEIDPDADDPPDELEGEAIDLTAYAYEHLALDLDPFPRKPGAEFEPPVQEAEVSPFAALKALKPRDGDA
jgi:hypothetical protein